MHLFRAYMASRKPTYIPFGLYHFINSSAAKAHVRPFRSKANHSSIRASKRNIFWREGADTAVDQLYGIMVEFDGYTGPTWSPVSNAPRQESRWVPIFTATARFNLKGADCTRTMFPLQLCYAITMHKSQGRSLSRAVLNLSDSEFALGLSYVAVLRVKTLGLMFESAFDLSRFKEPKGKTPRDRAEDVRIRNGQLI